MAGKAKPKIEVKRNTKKYQAQLLKNAATSKPGSAKTKASSSPAPSTAHLASNTKRASVVSGPELDVNSKAYDAVWKKTRLAVGKKPIHAEDQTRVDHILRVFDLNPEYGPCVGMTRLERWERANDLELNPPKEIRDILMTRQGQLEQRYADNILVQYSL